jgi:hypothetical protein
MYCPCCSRNKLLRADGKWFCPHCFQIYGHLPLYGKKTFKSRY